MAERTKMSRGDRARQFAPFDAMKGLQEALRKKEYEHEKADRIDVTEEKSKELSDKLLTLKKNGFVKVIYFFDGHYWEMKGNCVVDYVNKTLELNRTIIPFEDIFDMDIL